MSPRLAWLGLGNMGRGMCKNLVEKGNLSSPLILYNRTQSRAVNLSKELGEDKTQVVESIKDAITQSDIIFMCLGDDSSVNNTVDTILKEDVKGKVIVDTSTLHPDTTNALEQRVIEHGGEFVALPVFGTPIVAAAGNLICALAGRSSSVDKIKPYTTSVLGRETILFADKPAGTATHLKVIGNTFILNMVSILSEGHVLAEKSGLPNDALHSLIGALFPGPYPAYSTRMLQGDYYQRDEPAFGVDWALKDARHAKNLAERSGARTGLLDVTMQRLEGVKEELGTKGDLPSVYGVVRKEAGLGFKNSDES